LSELLELAGSSLRDAFFQVGVWVALMLFIFGAIEARSGGALLGFLRRHERLQPLAGAALGVSPGCGGAIFVMPLFVHGTLSFGTVIAALVATMGDSSWVILVASPKLGLLVHVILLVSGVACGYAVDALGIGSLLARKHRKALEEPAPRRPAVLPRPFAVPTYQHMEPRELAPQLHRETHVRPTAVGYRFTHRLFPVLWAVLLVGLVMSFFVQFQILSAKQVDQFLGGWPAYTTMGVVGGLVCLVWFVVVRHLLEIESHETVEQSLQSFREMLIHAGAETAKVTIWVTAAYFVFELTLNLTGVEPGLLVRGAGIASVWAAALVGLIPGCGPQILLTGLYVKGVIPFAALLANAISQDGDALFPLISLDRRSALWATIWTTIPAFIIGSTLYLLL